ncbi:Hypothetical protein SMAX5B_016530 [Scophthalmus maximus]|uniref:Uncharacterized protein n=1 Tax=Scophthalmus maximus TaxID=52904 RepID=A0A2U9BT28_SCOMX|nr:Hypothetical protein SMAX5B_016530 [Scophthalmus maximus]
MTSAEAPRTQMCETYVTSPVVFDSRRVLLAVAQPVAVDPRGAEAAIQVLNNQFYRMQPSLLKLTVVSLADIAGGPQLFSE